MADKEFIKKLTYCIAENADKQVDIILEDPDVKELMTGLRFSNILNHMDETNLFIDKELTAQDTDLESLRYARASILVMDSYNKTRLETIEARIKILKGKESEPVPEPQGKRTRAELEKREGKNKDYI